VSKDKIIVDFQPFGKRVEIMPGSTLLDAARLGGIPLTSDCGGAGSCGQCEVIVRDQPEALEKLTITEEDSLTQNQINHGYRFACQAVIKTNVKVDIPVSSMITGQRLQVESNNHKAIKAGSWDDLIIKPYLIKVPSPSLHDLRGDLDRVFDGLAEKHNCTNLTASPNVVRLLSSLLRNHNWQVKVIVRDKKIVNFLPPDARPIGLAVDLGTTKVAAYLVDLVTGEVLSSEGYPNPQIGYGEDVISRLVYAKNKPEGRDILSKAVVTTLNELTNILTKRAGLSMDEICEFCVVGNTAMTHLMLNLPVDQLSLAPYVPASAREQEMRAIDLGLKTRGDVQLHVPACVAGFVGADHVAMALASSIGEDDRTVLGVDIGTNTEIILSKKGSDRLYSLSCASGPAFEGAHIKCGMRAADGAIEKIKIDHTNISLQTIGNVPPVGICGSGIIDVIAELRKNDILNQRGRLQADLPGVQKGLHGLEYLLVSGKDSGTGEPITVTQHDIDEILQAKGAIMAGIEVLLNESGVPVEELDEIIMAGAFGTFLNLDTAVAIHLVPDAPLEKFNQVGNAAGDGARELLFSKKARERANYLSRKIEYIELSVNRSFRRAYAKSMWL